MHKAAVATLASITLLSGSIISCSSSANNNLQLATGAVSPQHDSAASKEYAVAQKLEAEGKNRKAIKKYNSVANNYALSIEAPNALLRSAELQRQEGQLIKSFKSYQTLLTTYPGTSHYQVALTRQQEVAHAAASGAIQTNFLGLKSDIARSEVETMLEQVRDNAPYANSAPKAQFTIGHMWEADKNLTKAIKAYEVVQVRYPDSSYAPQALYKVGELLLEQAEKGNRNMGNLDTAKIRFTDVTLLYPSSKQASKAKAMLGEIEKSDIQRSFDNARFYEKKKQHTAAVFYYREVIRKTKSNSDLHAIAKQRISSLTQ